MRAHLLPRSRPLSRTVNGKRAGFSRLQKPRARFRA